MYELKGICNRSLRLSVLVGEVAYLSVEKPWDVTNREWGKRPAPYARRALQQLSREGARQALAQVAEIALDMAENIDEWWED